VRRLRLAIYRPHANIWFRNTVSRILRRDPIPNKYAPLLDYWLGADVELVFASCLIASPHWRGWQTRCADALELWLWRRLNHLHGARLAFSAAALGRCDVLFLMHYGNFTDETEDMAQHGCPLAEGLAALPLKKVVHLTHFPYCPATGAANLAALRPDLLVAENNLAANSAYFRQHFGHIEVPFLCLPYTAARRFECRRAFAERTNKLVVTGSITYKMQDPAFRSFFGTEELQPMRRQLYEEAASFGSEMDCLVSDLNATRVQQRPGLWRRMVRSARRISGLQPADGYYSKDIVEIYNRYTMFAVPEEVCGLPAIGFVEGMACGAAYVGRIDAMYQDIGMQPGVHYIAYDGSVNDLMAQVRRYQQDTQLTLQIAQTGCTFARERLAASRVYDQFTAQLQQLADSGRVDG
jgi:hypothetical protein